MKNRFKAPINTRDNIISHIELQDCDLGNIFNCANFKKCFALKNSISPISETDLGLLQTSKTDFVTELVNSL